MGALGHYLEGEGIPTTGISLVREHTERIRPPRALWVTFELGRPLGAPDDPAFQDRVLSAALRLLEAPSGPVLADYPEPAPEADMTGWACPVSFAAPAPSSDLSPAEALAAEVRREIAELAPWHARAVARAGRTTVGVAGLPMPDAATLLAGLLDGTARAPAGLTLADAAKRASEDLKAFYLEALLAQPGAPPTPARAADWLWGETALGRLLLALQPVLAASADPDLKLLGVRRLVPAVQAHRLAR